MDLSRKKLERIARLRGLAGIPSTVDGVCAELRGARAKSRAGLPPSAPVGEEAVAPVADETMAPVAEETARNIGNLQLRLRELDRAVGADAMETADVARRRAEASEHHLQIREQVAQLLSLLPDQLA